MSRSGIGRQVEFVVKLVAYDNGCSPDIFNFGRARFVCSKRPFSVVVQREGDAGDAARVKREGDPKRERLVAMLADWTPISELMSALDWQAHTVRGALSTAAKTRGITIERQRVDGVTSYRVAG